MPKKDAAAKVQEHLEKANQLLEECLEDTQPAEGAQMAPGDRATAILDVITRVGPLVMEILRKILDNRQAQEVCGLRQG